MKTSIKSSTLAVLAALSMNTYAGGFNGQVKDQNGTPIKDANVIVYGTNLKTKTNAQGEFSIAEIKPGHYHIHFSSAQHQSLDFDIEFSEADITKNVVLEPSLIENVVVYASALNRSTLESASPISVLTGDELRSRQAATLGETLNGKPGIHSNYHGPVAGSPVIRGFDGPRVKITQNGLSTGDVSRTGPDHAIGAESATATQIEVLRGPASLLYGSGAIGGVVNVVDNRIPQELEEFNGAVDTRFDTVSDGKTVSIDLNGSVDQFAWHLDAFKRKTNNFHIPGEASLEDDHHEDEHHDDHDDHEEHGHSSRLANSAIDASGYTLGGSYIFDQGHIGLSFSRLDNKYGIPGHVHAHDDHDDDHDDHAFAEESDMEVVFADMTQDTWQLSGSFNPQNEFLSKVDFRAAYTDYKHIEFEDYVPGTTFKNESWEIRNDFYHNPIAEWQGVFGVHLSSSDFDAFGAEAFTPATETDSYAIYLVEERNFGDYTVSLGARYEYSEVKPIHEEHGHDDDHEDGHDDHDDHEDHELRNVDYNAFSFSAGVIRPIDKNSTIGLSYAYSQRAPSTAELYSNGLHLATQTFEIGGQYEIEVEEDGHVHVELSDSDMDKESSHNIDLTYRKFGGNWGATVSVFYNQSKNFTYLADTGLTADMLEDIHDHDGDHDHGSGEGLAVFHYQQDDAIFYGFESELTLPFADNWQIDFTMDYTRGKIDGGDDLPRIPPLRLGTVLNWYQDNWHADLGATWHDSQSKTAEYETNTDSYTLVNTSIDYSFDNVKVFLKVQNLLDEEARVHTSFIKDEAPLPGRNYQLGVRYEF